MLPAVEDQPDACWRPRAACELRYRDDAGDVTLVLIALPQLSRWTDRRVRRSVQLAAGLVLYGVATRARPSGLACVSVPLLPAGPSRLPLWAKSDSCVMPASCRPWRGLQRSGISHGRFDLPPLGSASGRRSVKRRLNRLRSTRVVSMRHRRRRCLTATPVRADWHLCWGAGAPQRQSAPRRQQQHTPRTGC